MTYITEHSGRTIYKIMEMVLDTFVVPEDKMDAVTEVVVHVRPSPTFVDAIALVRRHLWLASEGFSLLASDPDIQKLPISLYHRLVDSLAYAE